MAVFVFLAAFAGAGFVAFGAFFDAYRLYVLFLGAERRALSLRIDIIAITTFAISCCDLVFLRAIAAQVGASFGGQPV